VKKSVVLVNEADRTLSLSPLGIYVIWYEMGLESLNCLPMRSDYMKHVFLVYLQSERNENVAPIFL